MVICGKQSCPCGDVAEAPLDPGAGLQPGDVLAVEQDRAAPARQQTDRDAQQRGLAGAVVAHDRDGAAGRAPDGDVVQDQLRP